MVRLSSPECILSPLYQDKISSHSQKKQRPFVTVSFGSRKKFHFDKDSKGLMKSLFTKSRVIQERSGGWTFDFLF